MAAADLIPCMQEDILRVGEGIDSDMALALVSMGGVPPILSPSQESELVAQ